MSFVFKGIGSGGFGGFELNDQILYNIKWFLDQGFVEHGGYDTIQLGDISFLDDTEDRLHPVQDERFVSGIVWEGAGRSWVWESGLNTPSGAIAPFRVSGVYVDGDFHPQSEGGHFGHHVDYQNGRILFQLPQNSGSVVRTEYTRRTVHVAFADSIEFRTLMLESFREFLTDTSPSSTPIRENQIWLPSIFINVARGEGRGLQLGGGQIKTKSIELFIFADNPQDRNLIMDWLENQSRSVFMMADLNSVTFPFNEFGDINSGITNWPDMVDLHPFKKLRGISTRSENINSLNTNLFRGKITWEVEVDVGQI